MAFPYCVTQMYIHNTNAHTRSEMWGDYKQLFISLPFKLICLRSAARETKSNCFPLNTLDGEWGWEVIMTSPAALLLFFSSSPPYSPLLPKPTPPLPLHLHSSASVPQMGILTGTHLIEAGQTPYFAFSLLLSSILNCQVKATLSLLSLYVSLFICLSLSLTLTISLCLSVLCRESLYAKG